MKRQLFHFYPSANRLVKQFSLCSVDVKVCLFKPYCTNPYCTQFSYDSSATFMGKNYICRL